MPASPGRAARAQLFIPSVSSFLKPASSACAKRSWHRSPVRWNVVEGTMLTLYILIKVLHVLAAIAALGSNVTYGVWLTRAAREPAVLAFTLRGVRLIDSKIANRAYGVLLITGFAMTGISHMPLRTPWLLTALILYVCVFVLAMFGYTPTLKRQIETLDREGPNSTSYRQLA